MAGKVRWLSFHLKDGFSRGVYSGDNRSLVSVAVFSLLVSHISWGWVLKVWSIGEVSSIDGFLFSLEALSQKVYFEDAVGFSLVFGVPVRLFAVFSLFYGAFSAFKSNGMMPGSHFSFRMTLVSVFFMFIGVFGFFQYYKFDANVIYLDGLDWFSSSFYFFCFSYFYLFYLISLMLYHSAYYFGVVIFSRNLIQKGR